MNHIARMIIKCTFAVKPQHFDIICRMPIHTMFVSVHWFGFYETWKHLSHSIARSVFYVLSINIITCVRYVCAWAWIVCTNWFCINDIICLVWFGCLNFSLSAFITFYMKLCSANAVCSRNRYNNRWAIYKTMFAIPTRREWIKISETHNNCGSFWVRMWV